ncbi:MAG TPA: ABC transporter ATP-binding protein [Polyangia bacterium]|jgi:putative ABC transport system ATP-binding protein|nr:ABC transporter ATP-binding protein [Polyangia bacterium]
MSDHPSSRDGAGASNGHAPPNGVNGRGLGREIIRLERVSKTYAMGEVQVQALKEVSLSIHTGEMIAIMGTSGSGKSTLLNIVGTLDRPSSGRYFLDGTAVEHLDEQELSGLRNRKLGFVFQSFNLLPRDTALANVELPLIYSGVRPAERRRRAKEALGRVGLGDRLDHVPNQLSGGQQQRVSIARAIVNEPVLLLADEPTGALDTATSEQVMELFCELHRQGMTVALVTHDPGVAEYAERVVRFRDGGIVSDERKGREHEHPPGVVTSAPGH